MLGTDWTADAMTWVVIIIILLFVVSRCLFVVHQQTKEIIERLGFIALPIPASTLKFPFLINVSGRSNYAFNSSQSPLRPRPKTTSS